MREFQTTSERGGTTEEGARSKEGRTRTRTRPRRENQITSSLDLALFPLSQSVSPSTKGGEERPREGGASEGG